jgi:hypothetical protein
MRSTQVLSTTTSDTIRREVSLTLAAVQNMIERGKVPYDELDEVRSLLESLPLSTGEYGVAKNRLRNAQRYLTSQERGAARFELRMLAGSLRNATVGSSV